MIKNPNHLILFSAFFIFAVYGSLVFPLINFSDLHWPIFSSHSEGLSFVTYGKWRDWSFEYFLTDTLSGEFTVGYNFVSDHLLNIVSDFLDLPSAVVHSLIFGSCVLFFFLLLNYYFINKVFEQPVVALVSAVLISFTADSRLLELFFENSEQIRNLVHVPIFSLHLATGQSFGWILFVPTLCVTYLAFENEKLLPKLAAGLFLGILLQTHSLTFINVFFVIALYLASQSLRRLISMHHYYCLVLFISLLILSTLYFNVDRVTAFDMIWLCTTVSLLSFIFYLSKWRFYVYVGLVAFAVVAPYALFILVNLESFGGYDSTIGRAVDWNVAIIYYLPHLLLIIYAITTSVIKREFYLNDRLLWLTCFFIGTLLLSQNHHFNWHNHPYRFTINLIFPLSIFSALILRWAWKRRNYALVLVAYVFFGVMVLTQIQQISSERHFRYGKIVKGSESLSSFLRYIEGNTKQDEYILLPAERRYPSVTGFNSLVISYSNSRAFLPDFRYVFWKDRYKNRLRTFCTIFPNYPLRDNRHSGCASLLEEVGLSTDLDKISSSSWTPEIRNTFVKALNIGIISGRNEMAEAIRRQAKLLGWEIAFDTDNKVVAKIDDTVLQKGISITGLRYSEEGFQTEVFVKNSGAYTLSILGAGLSRFVGDFYVNSQLDKLNMKEEYSANKVIYLNEGVNTLRISWASVYSKNYNYYSDYISFISVVPQVIETEQNLNAATQRLN